MKAVFIHLNTQQVCGDVRYVYQELEGSRGAKDAINPEFRWLVYPPASEGEDTGSVNWVLSCQRGLCGTT